MNYLEYYDSHRQVAGTCPMTSDGIHVVCECNDLLECAACGAVLNPPIEGGSTKRDDVRRPAIN